MKKQKKWIIVILIIIILGLIGRAWWWGASKFPSLDVNPYEQYTLVIQSPSASSQISGLVRDLEKISRISGWSVLSLEYNGEMARVKLKSEGGKPEKLLTATQAMNMTANFAPSGVDIIFSLGLEHRGLTDKMLNAKDTADEILADISKIIPKKEIIIDHTEKNRVFKKIDMTLNLNNISYGELESIGRALGDGPIKINLLAIEINSSQQKLTGVLKISVVGN